MSPATTQPGGVTVKLTTLFAQGYLERRVRVYRRSIILIYRSLQGEDVQVTFAIDGRISADHEREFATNKGPSKMGILQSVLATPVDRLAKSFIGPGTAESSMKLSEAERLTEKAAFASATLAAVEKVAAAAASDKALKLAEERRIDAEAALAAAQAALKQPACRMIGVREHPQLLVAALTKSQKRLLIISPWIRGGVVDELFLRRIGQALDRGVKVYIGYGLGEPDREDRGPADIRAEKQLQRLANDNKNLLFKRFGNTHAKVLISDNAFCVATSFNWLSFRGDPNRTFREELGFLSNRAGDIEASFDLVIKRFQ
jgi:phosphatidylserine/phosphatidylglycerophosphate/cardiolipin synthase-like enzyme